MSDRDEADSGTSEGSGQERDCYTSEIAPVCEEFQTFPKPCVALSRIDLSPYVKPSEDIKKAPTLDIKPTKVNLKSILKAPSYDKFNAKCLVNVVRDDLEKLKILYSKKPFLTPSMSLKCKICEKGYSSVRKLLTHQRNKHMIIKAKSEKRVSFSDQVIVHELKEYHKCRKCPKIFEEYRSLKAHMKVQHKKRKCYICNYCQKKFVDRMFFKVHIKLHCEGCGELFTSKTKCMLHKRVVCKIAKLHQCKTCEISFFKLMDLKDHSYEHIEMCYVCDICKDQCPTKCGIAHHIYYLHSKRIRRRNPVLYITRKLINESLYLCKFCDESSVDKDVIERHVQLLPDLNNRVMTGYKDYYFCDQCLKKFSKEQDMLQHKWTHFLKTSDNSQVRLTNNVSNEKNGDFKTFYNINEKIPEIFQPTVVLEKIKIDEDNSNKEVAFVDVTSIDANETNKKIANITKTPIVKRRPKKTLISKYQCANCGKYYSTSCSLNRHIDTQHSDYENLRCNVCEETFVWPSLLKSHKCIRLHIPDEMPFEDARPEIHFDNLHEVNASTSRTNGDNIEMVNGFDDLNITESDNYMNTLDFEIPAPIVELSEENGYISIPTVSNVQSSNIPNGQLNQNVSKVNVLHSLGYKLVMQEVPIEF